jgi:hypothetical protein
MPDAVPPEVRGRKPAVTGLGADITEVGSLEESSLDGRSSCTETRLRLIVLGSGERVRGGAFCCNDASPVLGLVLSLRGLTLGSFDVPEFITSTNALPMEANPKEWRREPF